MFENSEHYTTYAGRELIVETGKLVNSKRFMLGSWRNSCYG